MAAHSKGLAVLLNLVARSELSSKSFITNEHLSCTSRMVLVTCAGRQFSVCLSCFCICYKERHWLPLFGIIFSWMCVEQTARADRDCDFPGAKGRFTALPKRSGFLNSRFLSCHTPWRCCLAQGHQLRGIGRGSDTPAGHCCGQWSPLALTGSPTSTASIRDPTTGKQGSWLAE